MKHTQGNWTITPAFEYVGTLIPNNPICKISKQLDRQQTEANAKLIAAAPYMLEALIACRKWIDEHGESYEIGLPNCFIKAKAAINKATL